MPTEQQLVDALTKADAAGDTASAQQFAAMIKQLRGAPAQKQPQQPNPFVDAARSIPGGLAEGAAMAIGLPGNLSDLANRGMDYLTGGDVAKRNPALVTAGSANKLLSAATGGYYQPKTTAGKYAETIASFVPAAVAPGGLAARVARVMIPGAASESAGQLTQGTAAEPYARAIGALAGGALPTVLSRVGRVGARAANAASAATTGKSFLNPETEARAQIENAMRKDGPVSIAQNTARYTKAGASTPSLVDVGGNNVKRLVRSAAASEGPGQNLALDYADTIRGNYQDRLLGHTRGLSPDPRTAEQLATGLEDTQKLQARQNYAGPYSEPVTLTPDSLAAISGPDGQLAIDRALRGARANQDLQQEHELLRLKSGELNWRPGAGWVTGQGKFAKPPIISGGTLDRIRIAMGERGALASRNGAKDVAAGLFKRRAGIDTALDAAPGLQEARAAYRQTQLQRDAIDVGLGAYNTPSQDYSSQILDLVGRSPPARAAAAVGHREALINAISRGPEGSTGAANRIATSEQQTRNLEQTFGGGRASRYQDAVRLETQRLRNANFVSPNTGSQTALRTADESLLNSISLSRHQLIGAIFDKIKSGLTMTPAERAEIVKLGISPARAIALAKRAPPSVIRALKSGATNAALSQANR